jgi:hypothetical protein
LNPFPILVGPLIAYKSSGANFCYRS